MNCFSFRKKGGVKQKVELKSPVPVSSKASLVSPDSINCSPDAPPPSMSFSTVDNSSPPTTSLRVPAGTPQKLRAFTFDELKTATDNFSRSFIVGEGGFGCVFKGKLKSSDEPQKMVDVAVKQLNKKGLQGHREWMSEVSFLGIVDHPNLVKLIGYCAEDGERGTQRLLVYEFLCNRSVLDHLSPRSSKPLSWPMRLNIALCAARGLTYLHEEMEFQIIFRDFKTSNILLDENWNAKLSDFGMAREGPTEEKSHVSTAVVGTLGYAAPEYMQTGHLTTKSDIWSYGIVLYELITGRKPLDRLRPKGEEKLLDWVRPHISNMKKFPMILDPRLAGQFSLKSAQQLAAVANRCLLRNPKRRPKMSEVLKVVQTVVDNADVDVGSPYSPLTSFAAKREALEKRRRRTQQT